MKDDDKLLYLILGMFFALTMSLLFDIFGVLR